MVVVLKQCNSEVLWQTGSCPVLKSEASEWSGRAEAAVFVLLYVCLCVWRECRREVNWSCIVSHGRALLLKPIML